MNKDNEYRRTIEGEGKEREREREGGRRRTNV